MMDSDDVVNQLTLNFLISKNQLQKLNRNRQKSNSELTKIDKDRVKALFMDLLENEAPDDLLNDVRSAFDVFINKCVFYFNVSDSNKKLEKERYDVIRKDIDYDKECDYREDDTNCDNCDDDDDDDNICDDNTSNKDPVKLPFDYFKEFQVNKELTKNKIKNEKNDK